MGRRFKIERDYYEDDDFIYKKQHVTFEPGLTVLVGCNGSGKTTLINQIKKSYSVIYIFHVCILIMCLMEDITQ